MYGYVVGSVGDYIRVHPGAVWCAFGSSGRAMHNSAVPQTNHDQQDMINGSRLLTHVFIVEVANVFDHGSGMAALHESMY